MQPDDARVALVTGGTSGIGAATARRLAADGLRVVINSRSSVEAGEALAAELDGHYLQADVGDEAAALGLAERAADRWGRLDVVVNNAGISRPVPHADLAAATPAIWRELVDVNLLGPWLVTTGAEPLLRAAGAGCVVNVASHAGVRPKGSSIPYAATKAALVHTTRLLAAALGPTIRVNAVAPGLVDTPMTAGWSDAQELWRDRSPMQRAAQPEDVADMIAALVHNDYVTGEIVLLDGGLNLR